MLGDNKLTTALGDGGELPSIMKDELDSLFSDISSIQPGQGQHKTSSAIFESDMEEEADEGSEWIDDKTDESLPKDDLDLHDLLSNPEHPWVPGATST